MSIFVNKNIELKGKLCIWIFISQYTFQTQIQFGEFN